MCGKSCMHGVERGKIRRLYQRLPIAIVVPVCFLDFLIKLRYSEIERKQHSTQSEKVNENQYELRFIIAKHIDFFMCLRYYVTMEVVPMINRPLYIDKIMAYTDTPFVKVLTGVRRCGKSTVLKMIMEKLQQEHGVSSERIVSMRFDSMDYEDMTAKDMFKAVKEKLNPTGRTYLFLDEVQEIEGWEKVVNSLATDYDVDLYVTGSNSRMLSSEIATYLTGRYVSFRIYTLSFQEYLELKSSIHR